MKLPKIYNQYPKNYPVDNTNKTYGEELELLLEPSKNKLVNLFLDGLIFNIDKYPDGYSIEVSYHHSKEVVNRIDNVMYYLYSLGK